jgi:hypothetical protein
MMLVLFHGNLVTPVLQRPRAWTGLQTPRRVCSILSFDRQANRVDEDKTEVTVWVGAALKPDGPQPGICATRMGQLFCITLATEVAKLRTHLSGHHPPGPTVPILSGRSSLPPIGDERIII